MGALVIAIVLTSFADPVPHDVESSNDQFILHVDPHAGRHSIRARGSNDVLWSFQRHAGYDDFFISDDGMSVAVVAWRYVKVDELDEPGVEIWRASGRVRTWSVRELVAQPQRAGVGAPVGWFWREWRQSVGSWGNAIYFSTTGPFRYTIDLSTATITDRAFSLEGLLFTAYGAFAALLAFAIAWLAVRARRREEFAGDRRRIAIAASAPVLGGIAQWLYFAGIPFLPAEWISWLGTGPWLAAIVMTIVSVFSLGRLPWRQRLVWIFGVLVLVCAPAILRLL